MLKPKPYLSLKPNNTVKNTIKKNLETHFQYSYECIKDSSFQNILESLIENNSEVFDLDNNAVRRLYEDDTIEMLEKAKKSSKLKNLFNAAKENLNDNPIVIERFKKDIFRSIKEIKKKVAEVNNGINNQIIFLEHNYEPIACFCGFGEGEYPILDTPQYIKFNYQEELFNGIGKIDYAVFWNKMNKLDDIIEELDLTDIIYDSEIYRAFKYAYKYKTMLFLFEAFDRIPIEAFDGIPVKLPLYIYANEHDCEAMNVYVYTS